MNYNVLLHVFVFLQNKFALLSSWTESDSQTLDRTQYDVNVIDKKRKAKDTGRA